ncbi:MAG: flavodoxin family protein [Chloroflexi bacterium]|nr:flavodoxin family protein [Chloroflexota bacterium]
MTLVVAINGSPRIEKGCTQWVLAPFLEGIAESWAEVELVYASRLKIKPCNCGTMHCWSSELGVCCHDDDMTGLIARLKQAGILVLATPVYIPLPGHMQNLLNRLCPLIMPRLATRGGRTRAELNQANLRQLVLVASSGWWEVENTATVQRIAEELALDMGIAYAGALLRPHADYMRQSGQFTADGAAVQAAARLAGRELIQSGAMQPKTLAQVSRPLIGREEWLAQNSL